MFWNNPPKKQVYEALGTLADKRLEILDNGPIIKAKVFSSSRGKSYDVSFDKSTMSIMSNDNTAYYKGYLSYPSIALLITLGFISYNKEVLSVLKDIAWKDINQKYGNDFDKVKEEVFIIIRARGFNPEALMLEVESIMSQLRKIHFQHLGKKQVPPMGY